MRNLERKWYAEAQTAFDKAIEDEPDNAELYFYAAISLLRGRKAKLAKRTDIDKIEEYIQRALRIAPKGIYYYFWAYVRYDHHYRKSYRMRPDYRELLDWAEQAGLSAAEIERFYVTLGVERPQCL